MTVDGYFQRCFASLSGLSRRAPLFAKTRDIFVIHSARETARHGWQCKSAACVGVVDGDGLFCMREVFRHGDDLTAGVKDAFDFLVVVDEREYRAKGMRFLRDREILHVGFLTRRETAIIILNRVANACRTRRGRAVLMGDSRCEVTFEDSVVVGV